MDEVVRTWDMPKPQFGKSTVANLFASQVALWSLPDAAGLRIVIGELSVWNPLIEA